MRQPQGGRMSTTVERPDYLDDRNQLHRLGYAQELFRSMGGFSNFAISFTIISILAGCLTSYALALGEIASTYPTAGGLYYWASKLGTPGWGWFTGWFNLVGQIAVTASIGYGCAFFSTALLNLLFDYPNSFGWIFFLYGLILLGAGLINMFKVPITAALNSFSAWWHMVGVLVVVGVLIAVPDHHRSVGYVFGQTINNSGFSGSSWTHGVFIYVFITGLLMAQYTITGFDASAHMSEETRRASIGAAWGIVMSVVVSVLFGFILLVAVTFAVPNDKDAAGAGLFVVQYIWETSMGRRWAEFLLFIAAIAQCFCTIASVTSASRMMFAFSRDRAVPGHRVWRRVSKADRVPVYTVWAICTLSFALMIPTLWNGIIGYAVGTSIAVIGLYIAFMLPIILRFRAGESFERSAWHLGRHYKWIDVLAIAWIIFISIVFLLPFAFGGIPWNKGFDWNLVNYTPLTVGGAFVLLGGWYLLSARKWFKGPVVQGTEEELERIEAEYEPPTGRAATEVA